MAIDPTTPLTPIIPTVPAGTAPDSVIVAQAVARQALANATAQLGELVGRTAATPTKTDAPVEQAGQTSTQTAGLASDAAQAKGATPPVPTPVTRPAPDTPMVRAVRIAAAEAVPRQAGVAPLMADAQAVINRPDMPPEVRQAARALVASAPSAAQLATPQGLRQAVERSGVFLETNMARAAAAPASETVQRPIEGPDMKAALLVFRGALSAWLAKTVQQAPAVDPAPEAPVAAPESEGEPPMSAGAGRTTTASATSALSSAPQSATQGASQSAQRPATDSAVAASLLQVTEEAVVATTSSPTQAAIAAEDTPQPVAAPPPAVADDEMFEARFGAFVATPKAPTAPASPARAALSALVQAGLIAEEAAQEAPLEGVPAEIRPLVPRGYGAAPSADTASAKVPPPPYAGGPMAGQKPATPSLPADLSAADVVRRLLKGTTGALARQDLMQIASLPEPAHHETETSEARTQQGARLNLDLPFVTPQGVAVAQLEISHDGGGSGGGAAGPLERTYKARFSIDVEPLGPVHAQVLLTGARARISLWAERSETIARLRAGEESLGAALRQAELSPEVAVHSGAPPIPGAGGVGHFVDQAS